MISLEAGVAALTAAGFTLSVLGLILVTMLRYSEEIKHSRLAQFIGLSTLTKMDCAVLLIATGFSMQFGALLVRYIC